MAELLPRSPAQSPQSQSMPMQNVCVGVEHRVIMSDPLAYVRNGSRPSTDKSSNLEEIKNESERKAVATPETPTYIRPAVRNAILRWKRIHEQNMMDRLVEMRNEKKSSLKLCRADAKELARKIPLELLAKDWLHDNDATVEIRCYLVDKILPTLILGVEKLLNEADKLNLSTVDEMDPNFNPINFLAQYLLRNNPKYSNFSEASPYVRGLREVVEELRQQLFQLQGNRLARIKAEVKRKREEREETDKLQRLEKERRKECLQSQFAEWKTNKAGKIRIALLQNSLRSFMELIELFPEELRAAAKLAIPLDPTDETGCMVSGVEFSQYLSRYIGNSPADIFDQFIIHLSKCAHANSLAVEREVRRIVLTNLFIACDHSGIGILDRHRILNLFENFYDESADETRPALQNPRRWPVVELVETEEVLSIEDELEDKEPSEKDEAESLLKSEHVPEPADSSEKVNEDEQEEKNEGGDEEKTDAEKEEEIADGKQTSGESITEEKTDGKQDSEDVKETKTKEEDEKDSGAKEETSDETTKVDTIVSESQEKVSEQEESEDTASTSDKSNDKVTTSDKSSDDVTEPEQKLSPNQTAEESALETSEQAAAEDVSGKQASSEDVPSKEQETEGIAEKDVDETEQPAEGEEQKPGTAQSVKFADGTEFDREIQTAGTATSMQSQMSAFDEHSVNVRQFVNLTENFLGDKPTTDLFEKLLRFIKEGYEETEEEKFERIVKARTEVKHAKRKVQMDALFEKWDNDGSGFLDLEEVEASMSKYKDGQEVDAIGRGKDKMLSQSKYNDQRLSKREFRTFLDLVVEEIPGDIFDYFIEFLASNLERSYADRVRGEARKKWLQQIVSAAERSAGNMEPVYRAVFQALFRDAEAHGNGKKISSNIAMLEKNMEAGRGDVCLRYVASTTDDADYVLNKTLYKDMKGISFMAVDSGKPIHVPRVANHGNIYFWNIHRHRDEREGSFIVIPLKDRRKHVFGILGIDTLADPHTRAIFITHEIQFFQGVAKSFSIAYHHVDMRKKLLRITESALSWIQRRSPHVAEVVFYLMEPAGKDAHGYVLRKMMTTDTRANTLIIDDPPRLERKDNLFRDYLFKAVDNSECVSADAYGERRLAFPLRDEAGKAVAIIDISIGTQNKLPAHENKEVQRMLRLLQLAHKEIEQEFAGEECTRVLDVENDDSTRMDVMFDRLMLVELRENVTKLDSQAYAELKSYGKPPVIVMDILKATMSIFYLERVMEGEFDDWTSLKSLINADLCQKIADFDPTALDELLDTAQIEEYLKDVPHGEVAKHGSQPAEYLYNWVFVCLSLMEHTRKMRANKSDPSLSTQEVSPGH